MDFFRFVFTPSGACQNMSKFATFRNLESSDKGMSRISHDDSPLGKWYRSVQDTPISEFTDEDLSRACRQELFLNHIVPLAIVRLEEEPLVGEMYEGEMFVAMKSIPILYWKDHPLIWKRLLKVAERIKQLSEDEQIIREVNELAKKIPCE